MPWYEISATKFVRYAVEASNSEEALGRIVESGDEWDELELHSEVKTEGAVKTLMADSHVIIWKDK